MHARSKIFTSYCYGKICLKLHKPVLRCTVRRSDGMVLSRLLCNRFLTDCIHIMSQLFRRSPAVDIRY